MTGYSDLNTAFCKLAGLRLQRAGPRGEKRANVFERYTEKARRVIFFARYEASQYGSPYIETEHLLLGLMREDKALANRFLRQQGSIESIRKEIEARITIRERISTLKRRLHDVERTRGLQRRERERVPFPTVALVGYTNAGKSTLMNTLTHAGVLVEDKLFATLDPTSRRLDLPGFPNCRRPVRRGHHRRPRVEQRRRCLSQTSAHHGRWNGTRNVHQ